MVERYPYSEKMANSAEYFDRYIDRCAKKYGFDYESAKKLMGIGAPFPKITPEEFQAHFDGLLPQKMPKALALKIRQMMRTRFIIDLLHYENNSPELMLSMMGDLLYMLISLQHLDPEAKVAIPSPRKGKKDLTKTLIHELAIRYFLTRDNPRNKDLKDIILNPDAVEKLMAEFYIGEPMLVVDREKTVIGETVFFVDGEGNRSMMTARNLENLITKAKQESKLHRLER